MELRHLRYFIAVAEAANFTKAAAKMRVAERFEMGFAPQRLEARRGG
jgi:DNA-binding transcriptional LysR family regulator